MLEDWLELSLPRLDWLDWFDWPLRLLTGDVGIFPPTCASIFCTQASISAMVIGPLGACTPGEGLPSLLPLEELCRLEEELVELLEVALPPGVLLVLVEDWLEEVV